MGREAFKSDVKDRKGNAICGIIRVSPPSMPDAVLSMQGVHKNEALAPDYETTVRAHVRTAYVHLNMCSSRTVHTGALAGCFADTCRLPNFTGAT